MKRLILGDTIISYALSFNEAIKVYADTHYDTREDNLVKGYYVFERGSISSEVYRAYMDNYL